MENIVVKNILNHQLSEGEYPSYCQVRLISRHDKYLITLSAGYERFHPILY